MWYCSITYNLIRWFSVYSHNFSTQTFLPLWPLTGVVGGYSKSCTSLIFGKRVLCLHVFFYPKVWIGSKKFCFPKKSCDDLARGKKLLFTHHLSVFFCFFFTSFTPHSGQVSLCSTLWLAVADVNSSEMVSACCGWRVSAPSCDWLDGFKGLCTQRPLPCLVVDCTPDVVLVSGHP